MRSMLLLALAACGSASAEPPVLPPVAITNLGPGHFAIQNVSNKPVQLATVATLERKAGNAWVAIPDAHLDLGKGYRLLDKCEGAAPACVDVAASGTLVPVAWTGMNCSAQCNHSCRGNSYEQPGTYRLVVHVCNSKQSFASQPFEMVGEAPPWVHAGATTDVGAVTAMRADLPPKDYDPKVQTAGRVAGLVPRAGTQRALDPKSRDALLALMRDRDAYDFEIEKRCKSDHHVAFTLARSLASTGVAPSSETDEVSIDFTCNRLFVVTAGKSERVVASGFMRAKSRSAWLALAKQLFPQDAELSKLR